MKEEPQDSQEIERTFFFQVILPRLWIQLQARVSVTCNRTELVRCAKVRPVNADVIGKPEKKRKARSPPASQSGGGWEGLFCRCHPNVDSGSQLLLSLCYGSRAGTILGHWWGGRATSSQEPAPVNTISRLDCILQPSPRHMAPTQLQKGQACSGVW